MKLPEGMQTALGEGGALLSGGEGQRVRMARSMTRPDVRLAILDEPARGLDRDNRREFVSRARRRWSGATLIAITHDVRDTLDFDRVVVFERGRIVEDGSPRELRRLPDSQFRHLLETDEYVRGHLWGHSRWRRLRMTEGVVREEGKQWARA